MPSLSFCLRGMLPTYYQLGLWRSQYLNSHCWVCRVNLAVKITSAAVDHPAHSSLANSSQASSSQANKFTPTAAGALLCANCHQQVGWLPPPAHIELEASGSKPLAHPPPAISSANPVALAPNLPAASHRLNIQAAAYYSGYIRAAIIAFKYKEDMTALPLLVYALRQLPRPHGHHRSNSVLLSVPTTPGRIKKRGFDPVTILSYYLSRHWNIPLWDGVSRIDNARSQQGLNRQERQQNLHNAFHLDDLPPKRRLILFDDVVTTGTTLKELASCFATLEQPLLLSACCLAQVGT